MQKFPNLAVIWLLLATPVIAAESTSETPPQLHEQLTPFAEFLAGKLERFEFTIDLQINIDDQPQDVEIRLRKTSDVEFELEATHKDYSFVLQRTAQQTVFALPHHQVAFLGKGESPVSENLAPQGILKRLISADTALHDFQYIPLLQGNPQTVALLVSTYAAPRFDNVAKQWEFADKLALSFQNEGKQLELTQGDQKLILSFQGLNDDEALTWKLPDSYHKTEMARSELESQFARGIRRVLEIFLPGKSLKNPQQTAKLVEHGELKWIEGQRVCILSGTPDQIGNAHGELLKTESMRTIDSVLNAFGTVQTIRTGKWFRDELEGAYARLASHIPEDHQRETDAMALALGIDTELARALNVFPELFHCSGFALFGSATKDGKLYHGRVLDYMTTIGLQDAATTFVVSVDGKIPFANVGYAGFIGSVTGMNAAGISLGEMGGRGEGQWDGAPMATLMRRGLEECSRLDQVMTLWKTSPRTCEYYYVFADGKTNEAVGVAATPDKVDFVFPGQGHELLGEGIPDAVVLSAGSRLEKLRERVQKKHGKIDVESAIWLMSRPVAMESNLHNALFVPEDGILYVANASHDKPAAERPYVKLELKQLLKTDSKEKKNLTLLKNRTEFEPVKVLQPVAAGDE